MLSAQSTHILATRAERLGGMLGRAVRWLALGMVVVTFAVVILRYFFNSGSIALQESIQWMHAGVFLLGAAWTLQQDGHVRVDVFYRTMTPRQQAHVNLWGSLLLLAPVALLILLTSTPYVWESWKVLEGSRETGGLPGVFLLKTFIPLTAFLLLLQAFAEVLRNALVLRESGR
jgi:TRAP-type mannitol/chloroaromatic compound transport system permease small subunit